MMRRPTSVEVQIRNVAFGGDGVGEVVAESGVEDSELLGITAFVPYAAVGERVQAVVEERKRNFIRCEAGELLSRSEERVSPPCPYFGDCGGCQLQHLSADAQSEAKRKMLVDALRAARCSHTVLQKVRPLVQDATLGYRRRLRLHVNEKGEVGFYRPRSRAVVPVQDCLVADAAIRAVIPKLKEIQSQLAALVGSVLLESDPDGVLAVLVLRVPVSEQEARNLLREVKPVLPQCSVRAHEQELARIGRPMLRLPLPKDTELQVRAGGFSQANWNINQALVKRCVALFEDIATEHVYDLFAGAGNFSLPLLAAGKRVTAVEQDEKLLQWANEGAQRIGKASALRTVPSSVESFCKKRQIEKGAAVLADPPRSGLGPLVPSLGAAKHLCFISCHLPSFVRDLKQLESEGWQLECIEPFDMFPQTSHLEILSFFSK